MTKKTIFINCVAVVFFKTPHCYYPVRHEEKELFISAFSKSLYAMVLPTTIRLAKNKN